MYPRRRQQENINYTNTDDHKFKDLKNIDSYATWSQLSDPKFTFASQVDNFSD